MKKTIIAICFLGLTIPGFATEPPKIIKLKNNVTYDHEGHKGDCISCHDSNEGGKKIPDFGKEWAHKTCIGCHAGLGAGPTSCKDCHKTA